MAKLFKKWVEGCEQCAKDKRVRNVTTTPELFNLPDWDLEFEDAMQMDLLPNLPPSGGFENVLTAIDVFSRYLLAYPPTDASAINVAKISFGDYRWVEPFIIQKVLPIENYIVRRLNTKKPQILHRILLKKFVPNQPHEDNFREERLLQNEEIVIPQDYLHTITWETNFSEQLATRGNEPIPTSMPNGERPITSDTKSTDAR